MLLPIQIPRLYDIYKIWTKVLNHSSGVSYSIKLICLLESSIFLKEGEVNELSAVHSSNIRKDAELSILPDNLGECCRFWTVSPGLQIRVWNLPDNRQSLPYLQNRLDFSTIKCQVFCIVWAILINIIVWILMKYQDFSFYLKIISSAPQWRYYF